MFANLCIVFLSSIFILTKYNFLGLIIVLIYGCFNFYNNKVERNYFIFFWIMSSWPFVFVAHLTTSLLILEWINIFIIISYFRPFILHFCIWKDDYECYNNLFKLYIYPDKKMYKILFHVKSKTEFLNVYLKNRNLAINNLMFWNRYFNKETCKIIDSNLFYTRRYNLAIQERMNVKKLMSRMINNSNVEINKSTILFYLNKDIYYFKYFVLQENVDYFLLQEYFYQIFPSDIKNFNLGLLCGFNSRYSDFCLDKNYISVYKNIKKLPSFQIKRILDLQPLCVQEIILKLKKKYSKKIEISRILNFYLPIEICLQVNDFLF